MLKKKGRVRGRVRIAACESKKKHLKRSRVRVVRGKRNLLKKKGRVRERLGLQLVSQ